MTDIWSRAWCQTQTIPNFQVNGLIPNNERRGPPKQIPQVFAVPTEAGNSCNNSRTPSEEREVYICFPFVKKKKKEKNRKEKEAPPPPRAKRYAEKIPHFKAPEQQIFKKAIIPVSPGTVRTCKNISRTPSTISSGGYEYHVNHSTSYMPKRHHSTPTNPNMYRSTQGSFLSARLNEMASGTFGLATKGDQFNHTANNGAHTAGTPQMNNTASMLANSPLLGLPNINNGGRKITRNSDTSYREAPSRNISSISSPPDFREHKILLQQQNSQPFRDLQSAYSQEYSTEGRSDKGILECDARRRNIVTSHVDSIKSSEEFRAKLEHLTSKISRHNLENRGHCQSEKTRPTTYTANTPESKKGHETFDKKPLTYRNKKFPNPNKPKEPAINERISIVKEDSQQHIPPRVKKRVPQISPANSVDSNSSTKIVFLGKEGIVIAQSNISIKNTPRVHRTRVSTAGEGELYQEFACKPYEEGPGFQHVEAPQLLRKISLELEQLRSRPSPQPSNSSPTYPLPANV